MTLVVLIFFVARPFLPSLNPGLTLPHMHTKKHKCNQTAAETVGSLREHIQQVFHLKSCKLLGLETDDVPLNALKIQARNLCNCWVSEFAHSRLAVLKVLSPPPPLSLFRRQFQHRITATSIEPSHKKLAVARVMVNNDFQEQPSACPNWYTNDLFLACGVCVGR